MHESYEASVYFRGATPWWGAELDNSKSKLGELNKRTERIGYSWHVYFLLQNKISSAH